MVESFPRHWTARENRICIEVCRREQRLRFEQAADRENLFSGFNEATGEAVVFSIAGGGPVAIEAPNTGAGRAAEPSADGPEWMSGISIAPVLESVFPRMVN